MDTKLKKTRAFSKTSKLVMIGLCLFAAILFYISLAGIFWSTDGLQNSYVFIGGSSAKYTNTIGFADEFEQLLEDAIRVDLQYKSEGNIREGGAVDEEELLEEFKAYYNVRDGVITSNTVIEEDDTVSIISPDAIPEDMMENYYEYADLVSTKLKSYRNLYIQDQLDDFNRAKKELESYTNFLYCIENQNGMVVAGNSSMDDILQLKQYIILNGDFLSNKMDVYIDYTNQIVSEGGYTVYAGVPNVLRPGDHIYEMQEEAGRKQDAFAVFLVSSCVTFLLLVASNLYLMRVAGQEYSGSAVELRFTDRFYNDVRLIGLAIWFFLSVILANFMVKNILYDDFGQLWLYGWTVTLGILFLINVVVVMDALCSFSRQMKNHSVLYNTLIATILRKLVEILNGRSFSGMAMVLFFMYTVMCVLSAYTVVLLVPVVLISAVVLKRNLDSLTKIMKTAKQASKGNYINMDVKNITGTFATFAMDVNNIQNGLKTAVDEAVRGEKMKTELITNVSHDLKTPLTSIISYVGLLQREELHNPQAEQYVNVIQEKSQRLKQLIEDLIEASKVSSGNLAVEKTKINLKELAIQACAEFEERAREAQLEFRVVTRGEVMIDADGRHMWRIFDNLLSNVMKYAMPHSRVYLNIYKEKGQGVLVMRNISQDEITVNVENLAERFVRNDSARTTEGSGLGLSIAKSLAVLQDGQLELAVEGDLFKVTVRMPLYREGDAPQEITADPPVETKEEKRNHRFLKQKEWLQERAMERKEKKVVKDMLKKQKKRHALYQAQQKGAQSEPEDAPKTETKE